MPQLVDCFPGMHEALGFIPDIKLGIMEHTHNPSTTKKKYTVSIEHSLGVRLINRIT